MTDYTETVSVSARSCAVTPPEVAEASASRRRVVVAAQGARRAASPSGPREPARPMRADARRNYDKILATARVVFTERGTDASLDEIAKRAGVGPGTLYRHFPTREALVDAPHEGLDRPCLGRRRRRHRHRPPGPRDAVRLVRALHRAHHAAPRRREQDRRRHGRPRLADVSQVPGDGGRQPARHRPPRGTGRAAVLRRPRERHAPRERGRHRRRLELHRPRRHPDARRRRRRDRRTD